MNPINDIKRLILRALYAAGGVPVPDRLLETWCLDGLAPRPLLSDVREAKRELEAYGFLVGTKDDLETDSVVWGLTSKGTLRAKQL
jgi:hypothetical protein